MRPLRVGLWLLVSALGAALAQPEPRLDPAMAYHHGTGLVVLYGGRPFGSDRAWIYGVAEHA